MIPVDPQGPTTNEMNGSSGSTSKQFDELECEVELEINVDPQGP